MISEQDNAENESVQDDKLNLSEAGNNVVDIKDARIAQLEEECAKLKESWIRAVAETDNVRKRLQRDLEDSRKYAVADFAGDMISVLENLKRALENIPAGESEHNSTLKILGEGVNLTLQELLGIFQKYGIVRIDPTGQKFDHNLHQAVAQVVDDNVEMGTVIQVIQAGYMIADRLLRPAMVTVSKTSEAVTKKLDTTA